MGMRYAVLRSPRNRGRKREKATLQEVGRELGVSFRVPGHIVDDWDDIKRKGKRTWKATRRFQAHKRRTLMNCEYCHKPVNIPGQTICADCHAHEERWWTPCATQRVCDGCGELTYKPLTPGDPYCDACDASALAVAQRT